MQYIMIERYFNFLVYIFTSDKYSREIASLNSRLIHVLLAGGVLVQLSVWHISHHHHCIPLLILSLSFSLAVCSIAPEPSGTGAAHGQWLCPLQ